MSRSNLVQKLAKAGYSNDKTAVRSTMKALMEEARAQQQHSHAERLLNIMNEFEGKAATKPARPELPEPVAEALFEVPALRQFDDLVLPRAVLEELNDFVSEYSQIALLRSHSLEPRHKVLLVGPPGTGKTSLAEALACELGLRFFCVRYDGLVGSYLGETATRLRKVTDFASSTPCVLFFDEFDTVGKERGDNHETGEIKRIVSSLLLQMDSLPSHCIVVAATNHPELLDRAVWRRFELRLSMPLPGRDELREWHRRFSSDLGGTIGLEQDEFVDVMSGENFSDIEAFTLDVKRKLVISKGKLAISEAVRTSLTRMKRNSLGLGGQINRTASDNKISAGTRGRKKNSG